MPQMLQPPSGLNGPAQRSRIFIIVLLVSAVAGTAICHSAGTQQNKSEALDDWQYPGVKGWSATTRKHMHSANGFTEDGLDKVLAFYKEKMESTKKETRDLQAMDSSSGSSGYKHAEGDRPSVFGHVLLRTIERSIWVQFWRGAGDSVTHIALVVDER